MLSCGALGRSKNPYIESIMELCVSQNQKEILAIWIWLGRKSWKRAKGLRQWKNAFMNESRICVFRYVCVCVWEKRINSFDITVNVNLQFKIGFKSAELLTKTSFFLYFRDRPTNGKGRKGNVESTSAK